MMIRDVEFRVLTNTWNFLPPPVRISNLAGFRQVDLLDLTLMIALYTAPPQGYGFEPSYQWASLRYLPAFSEGQYMKLRKVWDEVDSHQKTILSDDFGFAFGAYVADQCLGPGLLVNTSYFLSLADKHKFGNFSYRKKSKRGPSKAPDFLHAILNSPHIDIIECKGSQKPGYVEGEVEDEDNVSAVAQKNNLLLTPTQNQSLKIGERLAVGVFLANSSSAQSYCIVGDPEPNIVLPELSFDELLFLLVRYDLARAAGLLGMPAVSSMFWMGDESTIAREEARGRRRFLRTRTEAQGRQLEGTRRVIDFPRELSFSDEQIQSSDPLVSVDARIELPVFVMEMILAGRNVNSIVERAIVSARREPNPERPQLQSRRSVQTPFGIEVSAEPLSRSQRASIDDEGV